MSNATQGKAQGFNLQAERKIVTLEEQGVNIPIMAVDGKTPLVYREGDETKPVTVSVIGSYSAKFRALAVTRGQLAKRLGRDATPDEERAADLEWIADCVTGWAGFFDGDEPMPCTRANVLRVITDIPWIQRQIDHASVTHDRFFGASATG